MNINNLTKEQFVEELMGELSSFFDDSYELMLDSRIKNNGVERQSLTIRKGESIVAPSFRIEEHYADYRNGMTICNIAESIVRAVRSNSNLDEIADIVKWRKSDLKNRISFKLINGRMNEAMLKGLPHIRFLDFAIIFQCRVDSIKNGGGFVRITNSLMKAWKVNVSDLFRYADNDKSGFSSVTLKSISEMLLEMLERKRSMLSSEENDRYEEAIALINALPSNDYMYVMSNACSLCGASLILREDVIRMIEDTLGSNFVVIPSSIHELVFLILRGDEDMEGLKEMVKTVNDTQVPEEDILSYEVYTFDELKSAIREVRAEYLAA